MNPAAMKQRLPPRETALKKRGFRQAPAVSRGGRDRLPRSPLPSKPRRTHALGLVSFASFGGEGDDGTESRLVAVFNRIAVVLDEPVFAHGRHDDACAASPRPPP